MKSIFFEALDLFLILFQFSLRSELSDGTR